MSGKKTDSSTGMEARLFLNRDISRSCMTSAQNKIRIVESCIEDIGDHQMNDEAGQDRPYGREGVDDLEG